METVGWEWVASGPDCLLLKATSLLSHIVRGDRCEENRKESERTVVVNQKRPGVLSHFTF